MGELHQLPLRSGGFEPWLDKDQVARHFGVGKRTVERWVAQGCPSSPRLIGGKRKFRLGAVEHWLTLDTEHVQPPRRAVVHAH